MHRPSDDPAGTTRRRVLASVALGLAAWLLAPGCAGTGRRYGGLDPAVARRMIDERAAAIAAEPPGDYFVGRRYVVDHTRFWGYLRRPRQPWSEARLVVMNEDRVRVPDRLPEFGDGRVFGFDHNHEYVIRGRFTGRTVYDPNSNFELPEFQPSSFELREAAPGFLFTPGEPLPRNSLPEVRPLP